MTKQEKKELAQLHDEYAHRYNDFIDAVKRIVVDHPEFFTEEQRAKIQEMSVHSTMIRYHVNAMDAILSDLGCFYRFYKIADHVRKEVAAKPLQLS